MARSDLTDITFVLDRSGSMQQIKHDTILAFNKFLRSQTTGEGAARMSLIQFDDQYEVVYRNIPAAEATELNEQTFVPRGSTALLDAIGRTIIETRRRMVETAEAHRPGAVLFVIQTDGLENASREFTLDQINGLIAQMRDKHGWEFIFLGANQDAIATAVKLGMGATQALTYLPHGASAQQALSALDKQVHRLRKSRSDGILDAKFAFDEEDRRRTLEESSVDDTEVQE